MSELLTISDWLSHAEQSEAAARLTIDDQLACSRGYQECGFAVEYMLKAYIMRKERLNAFPSKEARRELYTHDLRKLKKIAGIVVLETDNNAAEWIVVEAWKRNESYSPKLIPIKQAKEFYEAVFGKNGVVTWLRKTLK